MRISTRDFGSVQNDPPVATGKLTAAADHSVSPLAWKASLPSTTLTRPTRAGGPSSAAAGPLDPGTAAITASARMLRATRRMRDLELVATVAPSGTAILDKRWEGRRFPFMRVN